MRTAIYDLETSNFYPDAGIILCAAIKEYGHSRVKVIRGDQFKSWEHNRIDDKETTKAIVTELDKYDIIVAHNGEKFDKGWLNAKCLEHGLRPLIRTKKSIDPLLTTRRHLKLGRYSLAALIDYLEVPASKTPIELKKWKQAALCGSRKALDTIAHHCKMDVITLEIVYDKIRPLIDKIDKSGSYY